MSTHTPGPWHINDDGVWVDDKFGMPIAMVCDHRQERAANARLIAAAPKLLLATKTMIEAAQIADEMLDALGKDHEEIKTAIRLAQQFVADAEGRS